MHPIRPLRLVRPLPVLTVLSFAGVAAAAAPSAAPGARDEPPVANPAEATMPDTVPSELPVYRAPRTPTPIEIDGRAEAAWERAPWTTDFIDIQGPPPGHPAPRFRTRAKMMWDDDYFYVYAEMEEPHVWGTLTERNSIIYQDNDFEVFIDPDADRERYYEFEVNALNTIMELTLDKPYADGGDYTFVQMNGVRSAVHVRGTLNDPGDEDEGWSVEIAIPLGELGVLIPGLRELPRLIEPGDEWRVNFSRVQWTHRVERDAEGRETYRKVPKEEKPEDNWVWAPTGKIDMHRPEHWGRVIFVDGAAANDPDASEAPDAPGSSGGR